MPKLSADDIKKYRERLIEMKRKLLANVQNLEEEALAGAGGDGDLSTMPLHMADQGSDTFDQEMNLGLMESEREELMSINEALRKIEEKSYGVCNECEGRIPKSRLNALPYATLCLPCKEKEEAEAY